MMNKKVNSDAKEKMNRDRIKEIISIQNNIYNYKVLYHKSSKRKWIIMLFVSLSLLITSILFLLNIIKGDLLDIKSNEIGIIIFCLITILLSYFILKIKIENPRITRLLNSPEEELEIMLKDKKEEEKEFVKGVAVGIADSYTMVFILFIAFFLYPIIRKFFEFDYDIIQLIRYFLEKEYKIEFAVFFIIVFAIGNLVGSPIWPRKYEIMKNETKQVIRNSFIVNLYLSKLNPERKNEKS